MTNLIGWHENLKNQLLKRVLLPKQLETSDAKTLIEKQLDEEKVWMKSPTRKVILNAIATKERLAT